MREIKFRAWDGGKMILSNSMPDIGFWKFVAYDSTTKVMQYTGLKDKNGKEIYEGDIVRVEDIMGNPLDGWKDGVYTVEYALPDCAFCLVQLDKMSAINFNECFDYQVIGNIYENPELLN